ncbi:MAG: competence/damage-inducible protein A [Limisphaerales bacterium]
MNIEILNTGSELMLGRVLNSHQQWLCRQFADAGYVVRRQTAVPDTAPDIQQAIREALGRADLIVCTGGLGPTSDDLTRDAIAELFGRSLREDPTVVAALNDWCAARKRTPSAAVRIQAQVPDGATVLLNAHGTAPGLRMELGPNPYSPTGHPAWLVMLPGPPRELRPMFTQQVLPWVQQTFPLEACFVCHTLRSTGVAESTMQERLAASLADLVARGLEIGYCARPGEVDVRLSAATLEAAALVAAAEAITRERVGSNLYGEESDSLEAAVVKMLTSQHRTVAVAESCTGGRLASRLTDVPGASAVFLGGFITYSNELKQRLVGVRTETLATHGAVSEATAREMAEGARERTGADYALAVTGIAGPGGGTPEKPVGTVFIALASAVGTLVQHQLNVLDRETFKQLTSQQALELLRQALRV